MEYSRFTDHFTYEEIIYDELALRKNIPNDIPIDCYQVALKLYDEIMEPIFDMFGPIRIISGYRSEELNELKGGDPSSQHVYSNMRGAACDWISKVDDDLYKMAYVIANSKIQFDRLIIEYPNSVYGGWIHISCCGLPEEPNKVIAIKRNNTIKPITINNLKELMENNRE